MQELDIGVSVNEDFLSQYLEYTAYNEVPTFFHRWSCIAGIGALLGRQYYLRHVNKAIHTNLYIMLIGSPGTRKNTAINGMRDLLMLTGYDAIAADKTSKEKFLLDLAGVENDTEAELFAYMRGNKGRGGNRKNMDELLAENLWGENDAATKPPAEVFIVAPEFNDFIGNGNIEFVSLLGNLWDYNGVYKSRIKNGKSIAVNDPTISIIGGNTPTGFSLAFPTEIFGQGFFSRLLLIYGEPSGKKISFPEEPSKEDTEAIISSMMRIKNKAQGMAIYEDKAKMLLDKINHTWKGIDDVRFESYANRRFTHLLKLSLVVSAIQYSNTITERAVIYANTLLSHTEYLMPKALGEFGKAKNSDVVHKVMKLLEGNELPMSAADIWSHISMDLDKMTMLQDIMMSLRTANKVIYIAGMGSSEGGYVAVRKPLDYSDKDDTVDWSILTEQERKLL